MKTIAAEADDVQNPRQRRARRAHLSREHHSGREKQRNHSTETNLFLCGRHPVEQERAINPSVLIGYRSGDNVRDENQRSAYA